MFNMFLGLRKLPRSGSATTRISPPPPRMPLVPPAPCLGPSPPIQSAPGPDDGDDPGAVYRLRGREQAANRAHHVQRLPRPDDVVADAATHQFAVGCGIVGGADHDDAGSGIANACEVIEAGQDIAAAVGLQDDHVRRPPTPITFHYRFPPPPPYPYNSLPHP